MAPTLPRGRRDQAVARPAGRAPVAPENEAGFLRKPLEPTTSRAGARPRALQSRSERGTLGRRSSARMGWATAAAPQCSPPDGRRIYNYGGWSSRRALRTWQQRDAYEAFARGAEAEPRFRLCPSSGRPAHPGGAQSLTLAVAARRRRGAVSGDVALCARGVSAGRRPRAPDPGLRRWPGGYRHEHADWAACAGGRGGDEAPRVHWVRPGAPGRRSGGAHTATYVPARCFAAETLFPEGAVILWRPHRKRRKELADMQLLCVKSWTWFECSSLNRDGRRRTATQRLVGAAAARTSCSLAGGLVHS